VLYGGRTFYIVIWYHEKLRNHEAGDLDSRSNAT